ncbi:hypothetical protein [Herbiconiux sp. A18JL235]|uniref:ABC transporter permease n=1 Tax=Herbiconiux sp. A18JL235 TaxID=3152363 RepID=A0AB39BIK9_9MICO
MTAVTDSLTTPSRPAAPRTSSRVVPVLRLHLINRFTVFVLPWLILGFIFLVNFLIWWIISRAAGPGSGQDVSDGLQYSGASFYIFVYMTVMGVQAVALTFPFALGYSTTRRDFWLGTSLAFVLLSALYAAGMTVLAGLETATNGWGFHGQMFTAIYFGGADATWYTRFFLFFTGFLFFFFVGAVVATIYQRWRVNGMLVFFASLILLLVGIAALITLTNGWPAFGQWFVEHGPVGVMLWSLVPTALSGVLGYLILRRTTPKG